MGEQYAKSINACAWKTVRVEGTVLRREGRRWVRDFQEDTSKGKSRAAWASEALHVVSRPAGASGRRGGAGPSADQDDSHSMRRSRGGRTARLLR